jgi:hypothetical protein
LSASSLFCACGGTSGRHSCDFVTFTNHRLVADPTPATKSLVNAATAACSAVHTRALSPCCDAAPDPGGPASSPATSCGHTWCADSDGREALIAASTRGTAALNEHTWHRDAQLRCHGHVPSRKTDTSRTVAVCG